MEKNEKVKEKVQNLKRELKIQLVRLCKDLEGKRAT